MSQTDWNQGFVIGVLAGVSPRPLPRSAGHVGGVKIKPVPPPPLQAKLKPQKFNAGLNFGNFPDDMFYPGLGFNHNLKVGWTQDSGNHIVTPFPFCPVNPFPWHEKNQGMTVPSILLLKPTKIY